MKLMRIDEDTVINLDQIVVIDLYADAITIWLSNGKHKTIKEEDYVGFEWQNILENLGSNKIVGYD